MSGPAQISAEILISVHRTGETHQKIAARVAPDLNKQS